VPAHARAVHAAAGTNTKPTLAHIVQRYGAAAAASGRLSAVQRRALRAIAQCRTPALGGQIAQCQRCGAQHYRYHSCRNRHCPQCQTLAKERWLAARRAEVLPVPYFHLVFTLPHELNALAQANPRAIYALLFCAVSQTLLEFGRNPRWLGGQIAATLLLHTWNQVLLQHIHLHCLLAGGALSPHGQWLRCKRGFLFPVQALSGVFRAKFLERLRTLLALGKLKLAGSSSPLAHPGAQHAWLRTLREKSWVVYAKPSLSGPESVLDYLGRYITKTAISNHRLLELDAQGQVRFSWRERAHGNRRRIMQLPGAQFLDRFVAHVLPRGFVRIRHIGLLANRHKGPLLAQARAALALPAPVPVPPETPRQFCLRVLAIDIERCCVCGVGRVRIVGTIRPSASPHHARAP
jgi:Putative transposase/Transposase zinc-binding domain